MIYGGLFDIDAKKEEILDLEKEMNAPSFWNDKERADEIISKLSDLKSRVEGISSLRDDISNDLDMVELLKEEDNADIRELLNDKIKTYEESVEKLEVELLLDGEYD